MYSVPDEAKKLFFKGILQNPLISKDLPPETFQYAEKVHFEGTRKPSIPINWRFAESISALKALEATLINTLLKRKYGIEPQEAIINTDHAQLFIMSILTWTADPRGKALNMATMRNDPDFLKAFPPTLDLHRLGDGEHRKAATNIYKTKDARFFHLHGSMDPDPTLDSLGLPHDREVSSYEESLEPFVEKISQIESEDLQKLASDVYKQAGTICWSTEEFKNSEHGKANAHVGLFEIKNIPSQAQKPCWWPDSPRTSPERPLAGLKVVDLTRVIAAPAVTRGLAELGASVMRVTTSHITDYCALLPDLSWGKWNTQLDFRKEEDREAMRNLVREADVVVQGYRPGVLDKYGFSLDGLLDICKDRERGLIVVRENCYGWYGPWSYRSGWQQISDAFGRAMGNDEPVTPVFPNSDFCTGVAGVASILTALIRRAEEGGSYKIDVALNYYSQWLVNSCGTYPSSVWEDVWMRNGRKVFRHYHHMGYTLPQFMGMILKNSKSVLFNPEFFEERKAFGYDKPIATVKPIIQFPQEKVKLRYDVSTRTNGVDKPKWPEDLTVEVVA
ncbi:CoA-transferase family III [Rhizodiscina lignyota]|uniref:CoA-transferase family III n=1 Tax=Rhizodiscina lignyota TaxID=1504668 RepID=A0A9P4IH73_9PEZI|nr:CoA-transferase family III [Rhizodiscina lignyota]